MGKGKLNIAMTTRSRPLSKWYEIPVKKKKSRIEKIMTRRRVCLGKYRRTSFGLIKPVIRVPKQKTNEIVKIKNPGVLVIKPPLRDALVSRPAFLSRVLYA